MPARKKNFWQKGVVDPLVAIGLTILLLALPAAVRLVQERQEARKEASIAEPCKVCSGGRCVTIASPPMCTSSLNECSSNSECAPPTPTSPPPDHECFTPDDCEAPGRCNVDCRGWPRKCRWTSCPEPTPTSPPEPTSPPPDHECFTPDDCEAPGRCNVDCRGWPRKCYWAACATPPLTPTPTPIPGCEQKNEYCSGTGQGNCCPGLMCAPLPGGKFCLSPICQEGGKKCSEDGKYIQECQNGQWVNIRICDAGCSNATCSRVCIPGATRCADSKTQETCSSDGGAWGKRSCPYGCSGGKCQAAPTPTPISIPPILIPTPLPTPTPRPTTTPIPSPTPSPTPIPIVGIRYRCDQRYGYCIASSQGSYTSSTACEAACLPAAPSPTPTPIAPPLAITPQIYQPTIQPTYPFSGITVGYGVVPPGYPSYPSSADVALERELDPYVKQALFGTGVGLGAGVLVGTSPYWTPAIPTALTYAYVQVQTFLQALPPAAQTVVKVAELAGTGYLAYECNQGNQAACEAGFVAGQMYSQQQMLEGIVQQKAITTVRSPEAISTIDDVVAQVDKVLTRTGSPQGLGCRGGACGLASDLTRFVAQESEMSAQAFQVQQLNVARGISPQQSFQHGFSVVTDIEGTSYLVDPTFSQFMNPVTGLIEQPPVSSGIQIGDPLAQTLLRQGYIELTDETLQQYLNLTTSVNVGPVTREILESVPEIPVDYTLQEFLDLLGW